jgi:hypothetical protein
MIADLEAEVLVIGGRLGRSAGDRDSGHNFADGSRDPTSTPASTSRCD